MLNLKKKPKQASLRSLPSKRSINLATVGEKPIKASRAIPAIILIILIAGVISKFAVYDRLAKVSRAQSEVASIQQQIDDGYRKIAEYGNLAEEYAHFTYSGMTPEELNRTDRVDVIEMIRTVVMPELEVGSIAIASNQAQLTVSGNSLQQINLMAKTLQEEQSIVNYCTVNSASTNDTRNSASGSVTARITIYLNGPQDMEVQQ